MPSSAVIEVAIGIVFVFLLASLLVSAVTEILASWLRWRGSNLSKGLQAMLGDAVQQQVYAHPLIRTLMTPATGAGRFVRLPVIRWIWPTSKGPSYIPSRLFAYTFLDLMERPYRLLESLDGLIDSALGDPSNVSRLLDLVKSLPPEPTTDAIRDRAEPLLADLAAGTAERTQPALLRLRAELLALGTQPTLFDADLQRALRPMLRVAGSDVELQLKEIESWFNDVMDRVSGWYKRKTQAVQIVAGLSLALALDIDTLLLARVFWADPSLRSTVVAEAEAFAKNPPPQVSAPDAPQPAAGAPRVLLSGTRVRGGDPLDVVVQGLTPGASVEVSSASARLVPVAAAATPDAAAGAAAPDAAAATPGSAAAPVPRPWTRQVTADANGQALIRLGTVAGPTDTVEALDVVAGGQTVSAHVAVTADAESEFTRVRAQLTSLGLPIRGSCDPQPPVDGAARPVPWWCRDLNRSVRPYALPIVGWVIPIQTDPLRWLGWILTALATSLGAPFWFDILKKFMTVRSAGRAPEEHPTAPKEVPQPREPGAR